MKKIALVVEAPDEAGSVECVIHRRAGDGTLLAPEPAPYRVMTPADVLEVFLQCTRMGLIEQRLARLSTGAGVWGTLQAELRVRPKAAKAQEPKEPASSLIVPAASRIILPGQ